MDESPAMTALRELLTDPMWRELPHTKIYIRSWSDDSMDTLLAWYDTEAIAHRCNATDVKVWRAEGTLVEVIAALRELPAPDAENAPRTPLPNDSATPDRDIGL